MAASVPLPVAYEVMDSVLCIAGVADIVTLIAVGRNASCSVGHDPRSGYADFQPYFHTDHHSQWCNKVDVIDLPREELLSVAFRDKIASESGDCVQCVVYCKKLAFQTGKPKLKHCSVEINTLRFVLPINRVARRPVFHRTVLLFGYPVPPFGVLFNRTQNVLLLRSCVLLVLFFCYKCKKELKLVNKFIIWHSFPSATYIQ